MGGLFVLLFLLGLVALPIGLIKPSWIVRREGVSRKKFGLWATIAIITSFILAGITLPKNETGNVRGEPVTVQPSVQSSNVVASPDVRIPPSASAIPETVAEPSLTPSGNGLSNDNTYTNSLGNTVHSPAYSDSVPVGASAICGDGTYSFSQSRRGTCSHHSGVARWL